MWTLGAELKPLFGKLGNDCKQVVFNQKLIEKDAANQWIMPGHPFFEIEIDGYHERFRWMLEEENPFLESVDGCALVNERNYAEANPAEVFGEFQNARQQTLEIIENLTDEYLNRRELFDGLWSAYYENVSLIFMQPRSAASFRHAVAFK